LEIIALFDDFVVHHVSRVENIVVNDLAQEASGFLSNRGKFGFLEKLDILVFQTEQSSFWPLNSVTIYSTKPSSAKPDGLEFPRLQTNQVK
jgi:hypothetical protein